MANTVRIRRWPRRCLMGLLGVILLLVLALGLLQTPPAKVAITGALSRFVSANTDFQLEIGAVRGFLPGPLHIESIRLTDTLGEFVTVRGLDLHLSLPSLLRGRVQLHHVTAERLEIWHRPIPKERKWRLPKIPELPLWPGIESLRIDRLYLGEAVLGREVELTVTGRVNPVSGAALPEIVLDIEGVEFDNTRISLSYTLADRVPQLLLTVHDESLLPDLLEMAPPVTVHVEGRGPRADWRGEALATSGDGTLLGGRVHFLETADTTLQGDLSLYTTRVPFLADYAPALGDILKVDVDAVLEAQGLLEVKALQALSDTLAFDLSGSVQFTEKHADLALGLSHIDISRVPGMIAGEDAVPARLEARLSGPFEALATRAEAFIDGARLLDMDLVLGLSEPLAARGHITLVPGALPIDALSYPEGESVQFDVEVQYARETGALQLDRFEFVAAGASASAQGQAMPHLRSLALQARVNAEDLTPVGALIGQSLVGRVALDMDATGDADGLSFDVRGTGAALQIASIQVGQVTLAAEGTSRVWAGPSFEDLEVRVSASAQDLEIPGVTSSSWELEAGVKASSATHLQLASLDLTDGNIALTGTGALNLESWRLDLALGAAIAHLDRLPLEMEAIPGGELNATATVEGTVQPLNLEASVEGSLDALADLPEAVLALAGPQVTFTLNGNASDTLLEITSLTLSGAEVAVEGSGSYVPASREITSKLSAHVPDLAPLGIAVNQTMAGALTVETDISGTPETLTAVTAIGGRDIQVMDSPPLQAVVDVTGNDLAGERPEFVLQAEIQGAEETLNVNATTVLEAGRIVIAPLEARSGDNRVSGTAAYVLESGVPEARLEAVLNDLAAVGRLAGLDVSGSAEATIFLEGETLSTSGEARDLSYGEVRLDTATFQARATRDGDTFAGTASLEASRLQAGPNRIATLTADLSGGLEELRITVQAQGDLDTGQPERQALSVRADTLIFTADRRLRVESLTGTLGEFDFALERPVSLAAEESGFLLEPAGLRFGSGMLYLEGRQDADSLSGRLRLEGFPVAAAGLVMQPTFLGRLDGEVLISGSPIAPEINASITLRGGGIQERDIGEGLAPLEAKLEARLAEGAASFSLTADMNDILAATAEVRLPVHFQAVPFLFEAPGDAPLSGSADLSLHIQQLLQALGLIEHHVEGSLTGAFTLGGTLNAPDVRGEAILSNGRYASDATGTVLTELNLRAVAHGTTIQLAEFSAKTGGRGELTASGEVRLVLAEEFPLTGTVKFQDAQFADLDYLNGRMTGELDITGNLQDMLVKGEVTITPVNVSMPDQTPVREPLVLEVTEIQDGRVITEIEASAPGFAGRVRLDIACSFPGRFYVRAPILDSEWSGNLHVRGTLADIQIDGRITVQRGYLDFLSRRFVLRDSALLFLGGAPTKPYLDMLAVVDTSSLTARLKLQGEMDNITLELSSDPPLPQDEILAHILFGRNLSRLSPVQAIQLARVAAMFNRDIAGLRLFSGIITLPGIDRIDIRTGERADEAVIGIGKYFTDSVYIEVQQGTATDSSKVSVEVEVSPQISIRGDVDAQERSGIGVFWRRDY